LFGKSLTTDCTEITDKNTARVFYPRDPCYPWWYFVAAILFDVVLILEQIRVLQKLVEVERALHFGFEELDADLQLAHLCLDGQDLIRRIVLRRGAWYFRVAELALEGREEIKRVAAMVGAGNFAFLV